MTKQTEIPANAFSGCSSLTEITIPESVTTIGSYAFYNCSSLTEITIPKSATTIGSYAFSGCSSLTEITIPEGVSSIGDRAFYNCSSLTAVHIKDLASWCKIDFALYSANPLYYGAKLYIDGEELTSEIVIPGGIESIDDYAFVGCSGITSITVDENNTVYSDINGVLFSKDKTALVYYPTGRDGSHYALPDSVTAIGSCAFYGCTNLVSMEVSDNLKSIGDYAFYGCDNLDEVRYYGDRTSFSNITKGSNNSNFTYAVVYAGGYCGLDARWKVTPEGELIISGSGAMYDYVSLSAPWSNLRSEIKKITVQDGITTIGDRAFYNCTGVTSVSIPSTIINVGYDAFTNTAWVNDLGNREDGILYVGDILILAEKSLINGKIKEGTRIIGERAFYNAYVLKDIEIPGSVEKIGEYAFYSCRALGTVKYKGGKEDWLKVIIEVGNDPLLNATVKYQGSSAPGDITGDGAITRSDLLRLAKYFSGFEVEIDEAAADVTGDGKLTRNDLLRLAKYFSGFDVVLGA